MNSYLLGLTLIAVAWVSIWAVKDHSRPSKTWWPFAMREPAAPDERQEPYRPGHRVQGRGKPVQRPWRRSGS
jgi:hypothetical protein